MERLADRRDHRARTVLLRRRDSASADAGIEPPRPERTRRRFGDAERTVGDEAEERPQRALAAMETEDADRSVTLHGIALDRREQDSERVVTTGLRERDERALAVVAVLSERRTELGQREIRRDAKEALHAGGDHFRFLLARHRNDERRERRALPVHAERLGRGLTDRPLRIDEQLSCEERRIAVAPAGKRENGARANAGGTVDRLPPLRLALEIPRRCDVGLRHVRVEYVEGLDRAFLRAASGIALDAVLSKPLERGDERGRELGQGSLACDDRSACRNGRCALAQCSVETAHGSSLWCVGEGCDGSDLVFEPLSRLRPRHGCHGSVRGMPKPRPTSKPTLTRCTIDELTIEDKASFRGVGLYAELEAVLRRDGYAFRILPESNALRWDRALFLNLSYWAASEGGDVLTDTTIPADVVAHVAWHHLVGKELLAGKERPPVSALFLGEAIASAFDLYLVGRLLGHAPNSTFLETQVSAMAETADEAGMPEQDFEKMLEDVAADPEAAFASLRSLLVDATATLASAKGMEDALAALTTFESHRFGALLHRYELSNWLLYTRAYGDPAPDEKTNAMEKALREAKDPLQWLTDNLVTPALAKK